MLVLDKGRWGDLVYLEKADYLSEYKIKLTFNTGEVGIVDLSDIPEKFNEIERFSRDF
jgi:hypothetical protein